MEINEAFGPLGSALLLTVLALLGDLFVGDPVYRWHPVRVLGAVIARCESFLRRRGWDGIGGGALLAALAIAFFLLAWGLPRAVVAAIPSESIWLAVLAWDLYWAISLLALRDLFAHAARVDAAAEEGRLEDARLHASRLVGRDTEHLTPSECRRAAIESVAENWVDGVLGPLFFLSVLGVPGLLLFKAASTLDSMVGYRDARYERLGKASARLDDVLCWIPARLGFALLCVAAALVPGASAVGAWRVGRSQHALIPGPNPGWPEAAAAGALRRRLIGPIEKGGVRVTELWVGLAEDPPAGSGQDLRRMLWLAATATALFMVLLAGGVWSLAVCMGRGW